MTLQTIHTPAGETLVVLPVAEYESLRDELDLLQHQAALSVLSNGNEELLSGDEVRLLASAATPLAFWRRKRGLTQAVLGEKAGIAQSYVAGLEAGDRKGDPALFLRLSKALGVRMEDLVADAG